MVISPGQFVDPMDDDDLAELVNKDVKGFKRLHLKVIRKKIDRLESSNGNGEGQVPSTGC